MPAYFSVIYTLYLNLSNYLLPSFSFACEERNAHAVSPRNHHRLRGLKMYLEFDSGSFRPRSFPEQDRQHAVLPPHVVVTVELLAVAPEDRADAEIGRMFHDGPEKIDARGGFLVHQQAAVSPRMTGMPLSMNAALTLSK